MPFEFASNQCGSRQRHFSGDATEEIYVLARALQALPGQGLNRGLGRDCLCLSA